MGAAVTLLIVNAFALCASVPPFMNEFDGVFVLCAFHSFERCFVTRPVNEVKGLMRPAVLLAESLNQRRAVGYFSDLFRQVTCETSVIGADCDLAVRKVQGEFGGV